MPTPECGCHLGGACAYVAANLGLSRRGARHRKRSEDQQPSESEQSGSGAAIAIGALLDGIPESIVLGLTLLTGQGSGSRCWRQSSSPTCPKGSPVPQG